LHLIPKCEPPTLPEELIVYPSGCPIFRPKKISKFSYLSNEKMPSAFNPTDFTTIPEPPKLDYVIPPLPKTQLRLMSLEH